MSRPNGRPPQPTELTVLKGNPGKRALRPVPSVPRPDGVPAVPVGLDQAGTAAWTLYWTHGAAWLSLVDIPMVARLCRLIDRADAIERRIDEEGLLNVTGSGRSSVHHAYFAVLGIYKAIAGLESAAGFTPADRSRLRAPEDGGRDEVDRWVAESAMARPVGPPESGA